MTEIFTQDQMMKILDDIYGKTLNGMGIIEKSGGRWLLTEYGRVNFTGWNTRVYDPNLWHKNIVDAVAAYCRENDV